MPTISVVTCWSSNTGDLLADYFAAIQGAEIITVNNAASTDTTQLLDQMHEQIGGKHIKNPTNLGFAAGNNQGYALAGGDIIIFLNSDVAGDARFLRAVAADVKDGALYGPSLGQQLVAGRWLPYVEGWCIAATKATWGRVSEFGIGGSEFVGTETLNPEPRTLNPGPWDFSNFPGPYWEDNDLCLRALQAGLSLIQTAWPIAHKGGRTAGPIAAHGASYEANRRTFTDRVIAALAGVRDSGFGVSRDDTAFTTPDSQSRIPNPDTPTPTYLRYMQHVYTQSDIQHHLPLLYSLARGNVVELGTRTGVSTAALLAGVEAHGGSVTSIDVVDCSKLFEGHERWEFIQSDSRNPELPDRVGGSISLLLIDTEHQISVTEAELALWAPHMRPGGTILLHDPETFPGVRRAVSDFCAARGWPVTFVLPCHGMAVIEVPNGTLKDER